MVAVQLHAFGANVIGTDGVEAGMGLALRKAFAAARVFGTTAVVNDMPDATAEQHDGVLLIHVVILEWEQLFVNFE